MSLDDLMVELKARGNWGHGGRPGKRGGSTSKGGVGAVLESRGIQSNKVLFDIKRAFGRDMPEGFFPGPRKGTISKKSGDKEVVIEAKPPLNPNQSRRFYLELYSSAGGKHTGGPAGKFDTLNEAMAKGNDYLSK